MKKSFLLFLNISLLVGISTTSAANATTTASPPEFDLPTQLFLCLDKPPLMVSVTNPLGNYNYEWHDANGDLKGALQNIQITKGGVYSVTATATDGSLETTTKQITITESSTATIVNTTITDDSNNNTIAVKISGNGNYDIALDDLNNFNPFISISSTEKIHLFSNVIPGNHTVYVRDKNGCGLAIKKVAVIGFPHFLTPNGDGINDTWNVAGARLQPNSLIYIFDRFGEIVGKVDPAGLGWNGTFNGRKLPSNDYWFTSRLEDGRLRKGHFSLVRR